MTYKKPSSWRTSQPKHINCICGAEAVVAATEQCARCYMNMIDSKGASASTQALKTAVLRERERRRTMTQEEYKRTALKERDNVRLRSLTPKQGVRTKAEIDPILQKSRMSDDEFFASKGFAKFRKGEENLLDAMRKKNSDIEAMSLNKKRG